MAIPKRMSAPTAVSKFSDLDLSCQHVTTGNFMEFSVAKCLELVPRQNVKCEKNQFTRLAPMPVPTYGNADVHNRAYFVPFRTVMSGWNEFFEDTTVVDSNGNAVIPTLPTILNSEFKLFFQYASVSTPVDNPYHEETNPDGNRYDFVVYTSSTTKSYRVLTPFGKMVYKLLCSLGYRIYFGVESSPLRHSALPLLCLMKVYFDWYFPSMYVDDLRANRIQRWLKFDSTKTGYSSFENTFKAVYLLEVFEEISRVCYDSDYFVSAWDNPVAPTNGAYSSITINDPTVSDGSYPAVTTDTNGTPFYPTNTGQMSQFALDALKSVSDYMKRKQIAGARVIDRYLLQWGITLPAAKLDRSQFVAESFEKIQFGDVTSTSDTSSAELGAYAGKGISSDKDNALFVDYTADEFGCLIFISTIVPKTAYYQGQDRCTFHLSRFDFYNPEFDALGVQALSTRELYVPTGVLNAGDESGINFNNAVFGFVPRFAEYKRGYDNLTGDLVLGSKNVGKEGWTLMRDVSAFMKGERYADIVHDQNFVEASDADQYNRIFYTTDNIEDKFYIIHNFVIKSRFPGSSLYDTYEFKDHEKATQVTIDVNGVRAN